MCAHLKKAGLLVFTDLDGTLLDHNTYSFDAAKDALNQLRNAHVPLVLCSSKTRSEIEVWRKKLGNRDPFICENGGGIFFSDAFSSTCKDCRKKNGYPVMELGIPYPDLLTTFKTLKKRFRGKIRGFSEMTVDELAGLTGLSHDEATLAKDREYTEPFLFHGNEKELENAVQDLKLNLTRGGRFFCLMGDNDKGRAIRIVTRMYRESKPYLTTVAIGDSHNDLPMLKEVDVPVLVQGPGGLYERETDIPNLLRAPGVGPVGWNAALLKICEQCGYIAPT